MKTTAFGVSGLMIVVATIVAMIQIVSFDTRDASLRDTLHSAMESSLETALSNRAYTINDEEELVADVVQGIALELGDPRAELKVVVNAADRVLGIISMRVTATYPSVSGRAGTVSVERTVVLEHVDRPAGPGLRTVTFTRDSGVIKKYTLTEGSQSLPYPALPKRVGSTDAFEGWATDGVLYPDTEAGRAAMAALPLDRDYTFTAQLAS